MQESTMLSKHVSLQTGLSDKQAPHAVAVNRLQGPTCKVLPAYSGSACQHLIKRQVLCGRIDVPVFRHLLEGHCPVRLQLKLQHLPIQRLEPASSQALQPGSPQCFKLCAVQCCQYVLCTNSSEHHVYLSNGAMWIGPMRHGPCN